MCLWTSESRCCAMRRMRALCTPRKLLVNRPSTWEPLCCSLSKMRYMRAEHNQVRALCCGATSSQQQRCPCLHLFFPEVVPALGGNGYARAVGSPLSARLALKPCEEFYCCAAGLSGFFDLDAPCTPERIRMACGGPLCTDTTGSTRPALSC